MKKTITLLLSILGILAQAQTVKSKKKSVIKDTIAIERATSEKPTAEKVAVVQPEIIFNDTVIAVTGKFSLYKKSAHASYYANKFNGRRTASGKRFSNDKYTAAHRKLPFGTILRVTNEANGQCVLVEVTDRGPFARGREIDLSKRAFMEIAHNKNSGSMVVKIEKEN
ncbi:septal ring lytic transglycosylase RlpA family protein [Flavobacterium sp. CYK-4]|uniref:septal ring lytic transglycosylase RlpA family protein n=1 Tax=Flavobacterium lotistagni TaxID=2709660 RepID=UPI00140A4D2E|nr:septal ring lytic transglycosylase RlpA family protein [Flavobacterium lotistagni]NHM06028.1 septal ring lytic transglycosylase RlpA family protein [Flavobacterium lotistagni]